MKWLTTRNVLIFGGALLAILLLLDFFDHEHHHMPWHALPGFDILMGALGCALIVYFSKWLGKNFLQKPEDHYDA